MKRVLLNQHGRLRNRVWVLLFFALLLLSPVAYTPLSHALQAAGVGEDALGPLPFVFTLLVTWACTRLRGEPLSSVGLRLDGRWIRQALAGTGLSMAAMLAVAVLIAMAGGVRFELDPARSVATLATGLYIFLFVALSEEFLFRGFVFQRLVDGIGDQDGAQVGGDSGLSPALRMRH